MGGAREKAKEAKRGKEEELYLITNACTHTHTYRCIYHISVSSTVYPFTLAQI